MIKIIISIIPVIITTTYIIGFIYDAAFLEQFGFAYFELIGDSLDYLAIGGIYLMFNFSSNLFWIVLFSSIAGITYLPIIRKVPRDFVDKFIHIESVPYVLFGLLPMCFITLTPIITDAKELANEYKNMEPKELICSKTSNECNKGNVIRYRASKVIYLTYGNKKEKETIVNIIPDREVRSISHS